MLIFLFHFPKSFSVIIFLYNLLLNVTELIVASIGTMETAAHIAGCCCAWSGDKVYGKQWI